MTELDDDIVGLMMRRAFDVAGSTQGIRVYLNGKAVPVCISRLQMNKSALIGARLQTIC